MDKISILIPHEDVQKVALAKRSHESTNDAVSHRFDLEENSLWQSNSPCLRLSHEPVMVG